MTDPIRLRDPRAGASPELRDLLAAGRSDLPDAKRLNSIAGRLALVCPVPGTLDALAHGVGKWLGTGAAKVGMAAMLVGIGTAVVAVRSHSVPSGPEAPAIAPRAVQGSVASPSAIALPETSSAAPSAPPAAAPAAYPSHRAPVGAAASARPAVTASSATTSEAPTAHPSGWAPSTWGSSVAPSPVAPAGDDPSFALDRALRDERSSERLDEQRDFVIIEALVRLGRMAEARERAARFMRIFPGSARRREVAELVGFDSSPQKR